MPCSHQIVPQNEKDKTYDETERIEATLDSEAREAEADTRLDASAGSDVGAEGVVTESSVDVGEVGRGSCVGARRVGEGEGERMNPLELDNGTESVALAVANVAIESVKSDSVAVGVVESTTGASNVGCANELELNVELASCDVLV